MYLTEIVQQLKQNQSAASREMAILQSLKSRIQYDSNSAIDTTQIDLAMQNLASLVRALKQQEQLILSSPVFKAQSFERFGNIPEELTRIKNLEKIDGTDLINLLGGETKLPAPIGGWRR